MFDLIKYILTFGSVLGITPSVDKTRDDICSKIYFLCIAVILTIGFMVSWNYKRLDLKDFSILEGTIQICTDLSLYMCTITSILSGSIFKQKKWKKMCNNLKQLQTNLPERNRTFLPYYLAFAAYLGIVGLVIISTINLWWKVGNYDYFKMFTINLVESLAHHILYSVLFVFTKAFSVYYQRAKLLLMKKITTYRNLEATLSGKTHELFSEVYTSWAVLKDSVDIFNDIFGWRILLSFTHATAFIISFLDEILRNNDGFVGGDFSQATITNLCAVCNVFVVLLTVDFGETN